MKLFPSLILIFGLNATECIAKMSALSHQTLCPTGDFCLNLKTPIQSGLPDESYYIISSVILILPDSDKIIDRTEITVGAGDFISKFDASEFKKMTLLLDEIIHYPGGDQPGDLPTRFQNCELNYTMEPGMHTVSIYRTAEQIYVCQKS